MKRIAIGILLWGIAWPAAAEQLVLRQGLAGYAGTEDTSIYQDRENNTNGAGMEIYAGRTAEGVNRRALLRFDLAGQLPTNASIQNVALELYVDRSRTNPEPYRLHRLTRGWGEGTVNSADPGGQGAPANPGDATWGYARFLDEQWTTRGGDFATSASATAEVGLATTTAIFSAPGMAADLERWRERPDENFGWIIIGNEAEMGNAKRFVSSEAANANSPRLIIDWLPAAAVGEWALYR